MNWLGWRHKEGGHLRRRRLYGLYLHRSHPESQPLSKTQEEEDIKKTPWSQVFFSSLRYPSVC